MTRIRISELLESLGLQDHGTSGHQGRRAIFHYEPLLRLYKLEIPSLFGLLLRDEDVFLDRADPNLFDLELDELLAKFGPLIWPLPGQGPRDHLLHPVKDSRYPADLVYPRDSTLLKGHLRNLILSKVARPSVNIHALIEKRHRGAKRLISSNVQPGGTQMQSREAGVKPKRTPNGSGGVRKRRRLSPEQESSSPSELTDASSSESEDSVVNHSARRRITAEGTSKPFQVALRLYRKSSPEERRYNGPCHSYGSTLLTNDLNTLEKCFASVCQHIDTDCTYMEFHPPEDMSLEGRIRIDRGSCSAELTFQRVVNMLREARKFPGEPSYRTIEVEVGFDILPGQ